MVNGAARSPLGGSEATQAEARRVTGALFILVGLYYSLTYIFGVRLG
jgi:hypothetical protein